MTMGGIVEGVSAGLFSDSEPEDVVAGSSSISPSSEILGLENGG